MKRFYPFVVIFFFVLFFPVVPVFSCSYYYDYAGEAWNDLSLTEYSTINQPLFLRFYPHYQVEGGNNTKYTLEIENQLKKDANIGDWKKYLAGTLTSAQIESLIYGAESATRDLAVKPDVREYITFSKKTEPFVAYSWLEYWGNSQGPDKNECKKILAEAIALADKTAEPFMKARYGFQAIRLATQIGDYKASLDYYNKYIAGKVTGTFLSYWASCYAARAEWKTGRKDKALDKYLVIFDQSAPLQWIAISSISALQLSPNDWNTCLATMPNNYRKEVLWFARELATSRPDDMEALKNIVALMPKMAHSEVVLMRKILLVEAEYLHAYDGVDSSTQPQETGIPLKMAAFCEKIAKETPDLRTPAYWYASAAYLSFLGKDYKKANELISVAKGIKIENVVLAKQIDIWAYAINFAGSGKDFNPALQKATLEQITWTRSLTNAKNNRAIHPTLMRLVANKYSQSGDKGRAGAALNAIGFDSLAWNIFHKEATDEELQKTIEFTVKKGQLMDPFLLQKFRYKETDLSFIRGWRFMERQQFTAAYDIFKSLPVSYSDKCDNYPSIIPVMKDFPASYFKPMASDMPHYASRISDFYDHYKDLYKDYSIAGFASLMADLKKQTMSTDPKIHSIAAYTYATICYRYPSYQLEFVVPGNKNDYGNNETVLRNYMDAIETSQDHELVFKSLVLYLLAAKDKVYNSYAYREKGYESCVAYAKKNVQRLLNEPYFKEYAEYCPLFKSFE